MAKETRKNVPDELFVKACLSSTSIKEVQSYLANAGYTVKEGSIGVRRSTMRKKLGLHDVIPAYTRQANENRASDLREFIAAEKAKSEADVAE